MKFKRIPQQQGETLEETYMKIGRESGPFWAESSDMMLKLIEYLEKQEIGTDKWVGTSHQLLIFSLDPVSSGPGVVVSAWAGVYKVEYSLPPEDAPWPNARVVGETRDVVEAGQMLLKAFERAFKKTN